MTSFGYFLSCEEYGPTELIRQARLAEEAGFDEVYIGQVGGEHDGFFEFYANTVLARLREV
jgi:alkanesulfonate monooxygenase SsuD/methylene tetrahydromethanopterin reductase-like flavin-dependent oxidoreductase (luciferase family)